MIKPPPYLIQCHHAVWDREENTLSEKYVSSKMKQVLKVACNLVNEIESCEYELNISLNFDPLKQALLQAGCVEK